MRLTTAIAAGAGLFIATLAPGQVAAQPKIYAYPSGANYCPAGLQPITISGVICCGTPNQSMTYAQVKAHPAPRAKRHVHRVVKPRRSARAHCPVGAKGCTYD